MDHSETKIFNTVDMKQARMSAWPGDLFRPGSHRLICGDATDPTVIRRLMAHDVARFVFTDAPFPAVAYADCSTTKKGKRSVLSRPVSLSAVRLLQPAQLKAA
jgi:hypothetical protein